MKRKIANLAKLSHEVGVRLDYVQGGGGNISVKISDDLMAIKASGYELKNVTEKSGFAFVNHAEINQKISEFCRKKNGDDKKFSAAVKLSTKEIMPYQTLRPSMETGFHSIIPFEYVIHSHAVYALILACSSEGKKIAAEIFPNFLWIEYCNPGWQLTEMIFNGLKKSPKSQIIFLQNHGLIVAGNDADELLFLHSEINQKIKKHLNIPEFNFAKTKISDSVFMKKNVLFPDQIVFGISEEFSKSQIASHIFAAYSYILQSIEKSSLKPIFISKENVDFVTNMESEKYRKEVAKK